MASKPGFLTYVKTAFVHHWNLLAFGAGVVAGVLSGRPDVVLPLVAAGELLYLGGLATHPKFQAHVNAQAHKQARTQMDDRALERIFAALDPQSRARFAQLRDRCRNLRALAQGIRTDDVSSMESMHLEGINRMLWVFLKLLFTRRSLEQFFATTNEQEIKSSITSVEKRIADLGPEAEDTDAEIKIRRTLADTLNSARMRLQNYAKAQENHEFIKLELERIESKITGIAEMAINRQDPDFITSEVDGVAATMEQTERAMGDLQFLTGLGETDVAPPPLMEQVEVVER